MPSQVYECPECGDRKLADYSANSPTPTLWCSCEGFVMMDTVDEELS